ncbi:MAG TPA: hypothetical protein VHZ50_00565 [Puia sp.]|nr:hypothetical protein [Puia sp.]
MEDHFEIFFEVDGKKYTGLVYPDHTDGQLHFQLNYHAAEDEKSNIIFMEMSDADDISEPLWVQRIALGEQPFLSSEFLQAAGAAIKARE